MVEGFLIFPKFQPFHTKSFVRYEIMNSIFDLDYNSNFDRLYITARKYTNPAYRIKYYKSSSNFYFDKERGWVKISTDVDCIAYVLLVLKDLGRVGAIRFPQNMIVGVLSILWSDKLTNKLRLIDSINYIERLSCGVFYYTKNQEGWISKGCRHMGFYFRFDDGFRIIHNSIYHDLEGSVIEINFDSWQMQEFIDNAFEFYIY